MAGYRSGSSLGVLLLAACAGSPEQPSGGSGDALSRVSTPEKSFDCMFARNVGDWTSLDDERFILYGMTKSDAYLGVLTIPTPDLDRNIGMAVIDDNRDGLICGGAGDTVAFRDATIPGKIMIRSLRKLDKAEAEMLLAQKKGRGKAPPPAPATDPGAAPAPAAPD